MFSFLRHNNFFSNFDYSPLCFLREKLLGKHSNQVQYSSFMRKPSNNGQDIQMKREILDPEVKTEQVPHRRPLVIIECLNISEADSILILNNDIYIEKKEMTGQCKSGRRDVIKDGKIYQKYMSKENTQRSGTHDTLVPTLMDCSLVYNKSKGQIKTHQINAYSDSYLKPLRQINNNVETKNFCNLSRVNCRLTRCSQIENTASVAPDQSLNSLKDSWLSHSQKQAKVRTQPVKRLNGISPFCLVSRLKSEFFKNIQSTSDSKSINSKSVDPFRNWCNNQNNRSVCDGKSVFKSSGKSLSIRRRSKKSQKSCKVSLERVDAKICFMEYLRLKPTVKTDVRRLHGLSLLRKYNIRNCYVVISGKSVVNLSER